MKRTLIPLFTHLLLVGIAGVSLGCYETAGSEGAIALSIESQDYIVSENGILELTEGVLSIQSISLIGANGSVPLLGRVSVDLAVIEHELPLRSEIPPGDYTGLRIELAPATNGGETLDVQVRLQMEQEESVLATSKLTMSGNNDFPEGARTITQGSDVELHILLRGMFFYLAPVSDAVDGHYEVGGNHRDFLTMNLIGMFDLRVLP
jgi:hypothetical protein